MDYSKCELYKINRKKDIQYLLNYNENPLDYDNFNLYINPYLEYSLNGKPKRLIEKIKNNGNQCNKLLYKKLSTIETPEWYFSKKGHSYIENALYHIENNYMLTIDISKFFPNTHRESIYNFFYNELKTSNDVACLLTNITTVDLNKCTYEKIENKNNVFDFINNKRIRSCNHLISGASTSCLLSFLVHENMFNRIHNLLESKQRLSVYVDDITISSLKPIPKLLLFEIEKIIEEYNHVLSKSKTHFFLSKDYKKATGVILTPNNKAAIPNKKRWEIINLLGKYKESGYNDELIKNRLRGLIQYARSIESNAYPRIYELVKY